MPSFDFNLQAVLTQRTYTERDRQRALGALLEQMAGLDSELRALDSTAKDSGADLRENRLTGRVDLAFLAAHRRFVLAVERKARAVIQKMALLQRQIDEARSLLIVAARERKVVEKLRERKFAEWRAGLMRQEQDGIDEVGSNLTVLDWQRELREMETAEATTVKVSARDGGEA